MSPSQEVSSLIVGVKDKSKLVIANAVRQAIWNWIEVLPNEYADLLAGRRSLDGAPERLFDMLYAQTERDNKQRSFWSTLTILLAISPERLKGLEMGGRVKKDRKVTAFKETLVKAIHSTNRSQREPAISCLAELSRAASFVGAAGTPSFGEGMAIKSIAQDVMEEVRVC